MTAHSLWSRLFGEPEEINGRNRCPTYLYRWIIYGKRKRDSLIGRIFGQSLFKVYLHHFVADDWSLDLHDHPKRFISIGLKGGYVEWTPDSTIIGLGEKFQIFNAPWLRSFGADHIHRLAMFRSGGSNGTPERLHDCWTLVIVLRGTREWGFWHRGSFIHWRTYVHSDTAEKMKACGDL